MDSTPRSSRSSSIASSRKVNLSLDLSTLPPLVQPTPPSNTLIFTNLNDLSIFLPENLQTIRDLIAHTATIHAFSPLKSFRRIIVSFFETDSAISVRGIWDGEAIMGERVRVYFGQPTNVESKPEHLALPDAVRLEDAPNKQVHAEDLADALAKLHNRPAPGCESPITPTDGPIRTRSRSSTLIYKPDQRSPGLPAVFVEDMTEEPVDMSPLESSKPILAHTSRPPVELMLDA
ncbi:hypothetical protein PT974_00246 [Cladobotryum mycophilum]|uniref:Calcipressin n=1 Tax=Cladobotryum mycophilum TaxID=491253 RepID=A0ABR0T1I6_9HYPO